MNQKDLWLGKFDVKKCLVYTILLLSSCKDELKKEEIIGYYTPSNYVNTFDTVQLKPAGVYRRVIYDKNKKLIIENEGGWSLEGGAALKMSGFYFNLDNDLIKFPKTLDDAKMSISTYFENERSRIFFCVGYLNDGKNCYYKVNPPPRSMSHEAAGSTAGR